MGRTAAEWAAKVLSKLNDVGELDVTTDEVFTIGVQPALAQFSIDRPHSAVVDLTPSGRYLALPVAGDGWVAGWSRITLIEAPAGETPPCRLDQGEWRVTRDPSTPATSVVLLPAELAAGEQARVFFTTVWPEPTDTAADDEVSTVAFEAVTALAASYVCTALSTTAALGRQGALPTGFVDGTERSRNLLDAAAQLRTLYHTFIGLGTVSGAGGGGAAGSVSSKTIRSVPFS